MQDDALIEWARALVGRLVGTPLGRSGGLQLFYVLATTALHGARHGLPGVEHILRGLKAAYDTLPAAVRDEVLRMPVPDYLQDKFELPKIPDALPVDALLPEDRLAIAEDAMISRLVSARGELDILDHYGQLSKKGQVVHVSVMSVAHAYELDMPGRQVLACAVDDLAKLNSKEVATNGGEGGSS